MWPGLKAFVKFLKSEQAGQACLLEQHSCGLVDPRQCLAGQKSQETAFLIGSHLWWNIGTVLQDTSEFAQKLSCCKKLQVATLCASSLKPAELQDSLLRQQPSLIDEILLALRKSSPPCLTHLRLEYTISFFTLTRWDFGRRLIKIYTSVVRSSIWNGSENPCFRPLLLLLAIAGSREGFLLFGKNSWCCPSHSFCDYSDRSSEAWDWAAPYTQSQYINIPACMQGCWSHSSAMSTRVNCHLNTLTLCSYHFIPLKKLAIRCKELALHPECLPWRARLSLTYIPEDLDTDRTYMLLRKRDEFSVTVDSCGLENELWQVHAENYWCHSKWMLW